MGKFFPVSFFAPFDVPENDSEMQRKFMIPEGGCSATLPIQVTIDGEWVVSDGFLDLVRTLEERGARRGKEYIVCVRGTPYGHFVAGISTFTDYLSKEDFITE